MPSTRTSGWVLAITIFIMGGCGLAYEYTFSKIAADLLGNSVQQWAIVIAVMLFCMGMGAEIQKWVSDKIILQALLGSQLALALLGGFGPLLMLLSFAHFPYHFGLIQYSLISIIGVLIGFEIPLISRLNEAYSSDIRANLARVLKMDYIGALAGALVWVFVLPRFFTLHETAYILAYLSIATAAFCWYYFRARTRSRVIPIVAIIATTVAITAGFSQSDKWAIDSEQQLYQDRVIFSTSTRYQHIVLTESLSGNFRCYINGHIQFSSTDEHIYHEQLVHPAMLASNVAKRILILGGGDGMAVREVLKYPQVEEIILVDLDPEMTKLAAEHPIMSQLNGYSLADQRLKSVTSQGISSDGSYQLETQPQRRLKQVTSTAPKLKVINIDAASYIKSAEGLFDVIILDFPDPSGPELAKLYSMHFYGELKNKLTADGIMIQQSTSPYRAKEAFLCIGRTMQAAGFSAIPSHDHVPSFGEWGWWIASHAELTSDEQLRQRIQQIETIPVATKYLTAELIHASLLFGKGQLSSDYSNITTISNSAVLEHYTSGWEN
jgi:spermidine synthase